MIFLLICTVSAVSADGTFSEAESAINAAGSGETVFLNNTTYYNTNGVDIFIYSNNIVICGGSELEPYKTSTFDSGGSSRIMWITGNNITFIGINFINGVATDTHGGGAIYFSPTYNPESNNNHWINCTFINNKALDSQNGIGGAIYFGLTSNNNTWENCYFENNEAQLGGAITFGLNDDYTISNDDNRWINCTFLNNKVNRNGGAIYFFSGSNNNWEDSYFINNTAIDGAAGAIFFFRESNNFNHWENCYFINNKAASNNLDYNGGGAICFYSYSNDNSWDNCSFVNNFAYTDGGAIYFTSGSNCANNIWNSCSFINNTASSKGGAIYFKAASECDISYCIFDYCNATKGKAIYILSEYIDGLNFNDNFWGINNTEDFINLGLISNDFNNFTPENYVILNISATGKDYTLYFASNTAPEDLTGKMPDYIVNVKFNNGNDVIANMGKHSYPDGLKGSTIIKAYGLLSGNLLAETQVNVIPNSTVIELKGNNVTKYVNGTERYVVSLKENGNPVPNETIFITLNGVYYYYKTDNNGIVRVDLDLPVGNYTAIAKWKNYTTENTITVKSVPLDYELIGSDVVKYANGTECYTVTLLEKGNPLMGEKIIITLNGEDYFRVTDVNGTVSVPLNLDVGTYTVTAQWKNLTVKNTVTVKTVPHNYELNAGDVLKYFNGGERYVITLTDDGKALSGEKIIITLNGVEYTRITDENGTASLAINLNAGEYLVTASWKDLTVKNTVTVKSTIISDDFVKFYLNGTQYEAYVLDSEGNPLDGVDVTFNIHGVFYHKVAHNGVVKLAINLLPGQYIITAYNEATGEANSNYVVVLPTLFGTDLTMSYKDGSAYECTLLDGQGKAVNGALVTFNINGVFYQKLTDDDGIARLNINLLPGEYIITAIYGSAMTSNIITVREL